MNKLDVKMKFNLNKDELKNFIKENMLIFLNHDRSIGYIALDNKDRI